MSRIRSNVYAKEDNHVPSWVFFSFLSLNLIDQFLFPHFKFFKASYLCISLSLPRCVYFTLDLGEKCKKPGVRFPTVSLNNYSSFILNTYFLAGSIKCVKKHAFFWDAQLTAEWPRSVVGLGEPCGVGSHLYRVSRGAASPPGAPSVLEGGAQGGILLPSLKASRTCWETPPEAQVWLPCGILWCKYFKYNFEDFAIKNSLMWLWAQPTAN